VRKAQTLAIDGEMRVLPRPRSAGHWPGHGVPLRKTSRRVVSCRMLAVRPLEFGEDLFRPQLARRVAQRRAAALRSEFVEASGTR
jgi:hypothetical protein